MGNSILTQREKEIFTYLIKNNKQKVQVANQ